MNRFIFTIYFVAGIFILSSVANAQTGWKWGVGGVHVTAEASPIITDIDGNVYASGTGGGVFGTDTLSIGGVYITKVDSAGTFLWVKLVPTGFVGMASDPYGNLYILGTTIASTGRVTYVLIKYLPSGTRLWIKNIALNNTSGANNYIFGGIGIDGAGNVYVSGDFNTAVDTLGASVLYNRSTINHYDAFLAKCDSSGNAIWAKTFGGANNDFVYALSATATGDVYVSGVDESDTLHIGATDLLNPLVLDMSFLARFDSSGNLSWAENISGKIIINGMKSDQSGSICMAGSLTGSVIIGHDTLSCLGSSNMLVAKYDSSGNAIWGTAAGGSDDDKGYGIDVDGCGNVWVCGDMGGSGLGAGVPYTMNFQGHVLAALPHGNDPMFIAEYNSSGKYITAIPMTSGGDDQSGIAADKLGNVYVCGDYEDSTFVIGPDTMVTVLSPYSNTEYLFIARYAYSASANNLSDTFLCTAVADSPIAVLTAPAGDNYLWSDGTSGPTDTVLAPGSYWVITTGGCGYVTDSFHVTFTYPSHACLTGVNPIAAGNGEIEIYPNPAFEECTVHSDLPFNSGSRAGLYDLTGRLVSTFVLTGNSTVLPLAGLSPGMYQCRIVTGDNTVVVKKLVIMK